MRTHPKTNFFIFQHFSGYFQGYAKNLPALSSVAVLGVSDKVKTAVINKIKIKGVYYNATVQTLILDDFEVQWAYPFTIEWFY